MLVERILAVRLRRICRGWQNVRVAACCDDVWRMSAALKQGADVEDQMADTQIMLQPTRLTAPSTW